MLRETAFATARSAWAAVRAWPASGPARDVDAGLRAEAPSERRVRPDPGDAHSRVRRLQLQADGEVRVTADQLLEPDRAVGRVLRPPAEVAPQHHRAQVQVGGERGLPGEDECVVAVRHLHACRALEHDADGGAVVRPEPFDRKCGGVRGGRAWGRSCLPRGIRAHVEQGMYRMVERRSGCPWDDVVDEHDAVGRTDPSAEPEGGRRHGRDPVRGAPRTGPHVAVVRRPVHRGQALLDAAGVHERVPGLNAAAGPSGVGVRVRPQPFPGRGPQARTPPPVLEVDAHVERFAPPSRPSARGGEGARGRGDHGRRSRTSRSASAAIR